MDGIGLDVVTKEFLAIEFKRTQDMRSNHVDEITAVAQKQYNSLLMGLQSIGQNKGWKVQQLVFVGGTCGSVHVESFNSNIKALGVLESKWDLKPLAHLNHLEVCLESGMDVQIVGETNPASTTMPGEYSTHDGVL
jgi:hypothetical protein